MAFHRNALQSPPVLGLVIVHDETGMDDAGNPAGQSQEQAQDETKQAARHQDRNRREDDTEKIAQGFQGK